MECIDLFVTVWTAAHVATHARFSQQPALVDDACLAYFTRSARSEVSEVNRRRRVARGAVAKPQRTDGLVGRVVAAQEDGWLRDVTRFLLGYVATDGAPSSGWPVDVLTQRKNLWDGGTRVVGAPTARAELRDDVEKVLATVRREAGDRWLHDHLLVPLANRGDHELPAHNDHLRTLWAEPDHTEEFAVDSALAAFRRAVARGAQPVAALRSAVERLFHDEPPPANWVKASRDDLGMRRLASQLLADLGAWEVA